MTSSTEDCLNSNLFDGKALETLIIASVRTLKRGNKKCGREEVSKLVNDTLCNEICKDLFNETLDSLIENQFIKCNIISNRECLSLPKDSELHHRSIQSTQEDSSVHEHQNFCALSDSETNRKSFPFKEELEAFKVQIISEIKNLIHKEISALKEAITTQSNIDVDSGKAQTEVFYQEQLRFINEELRNKDNLINSLLHQLSKQTECITSLNNRFSNNAIDDNNNNNDNLNRKNNSHSNEYKITTATKDSFRNSGNKSIRGDQILKKPNEIPSSLKRGALPEPHQALENIRRRNINRLIFAQLNINSLRNKFESLQHMINKNIDVLLISETKIDFSFPSAQFHLEGYATPYRLDRNANGGGILLYIREDIPSKLLNTDLSIEGFFVEIRLRKKKWLLCSSYNPKKNLITNHLKCIGRNLDSQLGQYENFILMGDFNVEPNDANMKDFCQIYGCKNIVKDKNCFKNPINPTCIDLIITNRPISFQESEVIETGLSDFHKMSLTVMKVFYNKQKPKIIQYRK